MNNVYYCGSIQEKKYILLIISFILGIEHITDTTSEFAKLKIVLSFRYHIRPLFR